jgi:hypothetical protein
MGCFPRTVAQAYPGVPLPCLMGVSFWADTKRREAWQVLFCYWHPANLGKSLSVTWEEPLTWIPGVLAALPVWDSGNGVWVGMKVFFFFFFFAVLSLELRAYTLILSLSLFFVVGFFEIGSRELFAWTDFEPWSSWSLPPVARITGVSHQATWLAWKFYCVSVCFCFVL